MLSEDSILIESWMIQMRISHSGSTGGGHTPERVGAVVLPGSWICLTLRFVVFSLIFLNIFLSRLPDPDYLVTSGPHFWHVQE